MNDSERLHPENLRPLTVQERDKILYTWNDTQHDYPRESTLHEIFSANAKRMPEKIAVSYENAHLTFAELEKRSNQLAHHLMSLGVGVESRVGLLVHRSLDMMIGIVGILKAGGAYVPIDIDLPTARIQMMLEDADPALVLTHEDLLPNLDADTHTIVCLDRDWTQIEEHSELAPLVSMNSDNLAYVIYTSGSTGKPKGAQNMHRSVVNALNSFVRRAGLTADDHILSTSIISFDASIREIFLPLTLGARLTIAPRDALVDGAKIQRLIDESGITFMRGTPTGWQLYLETGWQGHPDLIIHSGGEALGLNLAKKLQHHCRILWQEYGPAETAMSSTVGFIPPDPDLITIGRPHDNVQIYILDEDMQPVPVGVAGELYIGGDGVGRGYHNRPKLTAERFIANPFVDQDSGIRGTMYRTGDLARFLPDGRIQFLGRNDSQVKIQGRRIELGEIEAALHWHPAIAQNLVVAREDTVAGIRLVAYLVVERGRKAPDTRELREFLGRILPNYMVPARYVFLDRFPVTPNGKIDRCALPVPDRSVEELTSEHVEPQSEMEKEMATLFAEVLNLERISINDSFFDLGGNSLLAARFLYKAEEIFHVKGTLRDFLPQPDVAGYCRFIDTRRREMESMDGGQDSTLTLDSGESKMRADRNGLLEQSNLTRNQFLMWVGQQMNPDVPVYNVVHTFAIHGLLDIGAFRSAFQALVDHNDAFRIIFRSSNGVPQQEVLERVRATVDFIDFSQEADPESSFQVFLDERKQKPLALDRPLFDVALLKMEDDRYIWYLCQHHIITDAESVELIFERLSHYYQLALQDRLGDIPEPPQFQEFVNYERELRHTAAYQQAIGYWQDKNDKSLPPTEFYGRTLADATLSFERIIYPVGANRSALLRQIAMSDKFASPSLDISLFTIFATLLLATIHRLNGHARLRLGTPFHGRPTTEALDIIGLFIEMGVIQVDIEEEETFLSLGEKIMADLLESVAHVQPGISSAERNRAYDVVLNFIQARFTDFAGLPVLKEPVHSGFIDADHNLRLQIIDYDSSGNFVLLFDMKTDLFGPTERNWLVEHFVRVVDAFIADHTQKVGNFSLLDKAQRQRLLVDFNATDAAYPTAETVVQLFEKQVRKTPHKIAANDVDRTITYQSLNERANRLAHFLITQGVQPERTVAICMNRSIEVLVAIWAVLKAGGAYVPIDPSYPGKRINFMLKDAAPLVVLTGGGVSLPEMEGETNWTPTNLESLDLSNYSKANPSSPVCRTDLAYVIYTSGSTGKPKGTMLTHRGLLNYACWAQATYQQPGEILDFPLYSSLSFDLTITSIFVPLLSGGKVVIYSEAEDSHGLEILSVLAEDKVDIVKLTPAHLALVLEAGVSSRRIRKLIVGGEDFKRDLAHAAHSAFAGQIEIYNEYGPTEAVVGCMIHRFDPERDKGLSVPIGKPAANTRIYLLDAYDQPVPPGVVGEMVISSDGVARGYINRQGLNAERFGNDPFRSGARIYRTGDIGRWDEHGQLNFLGRSDHQVKIRGARIELGEIEAAIKRHSSVETVVVEVIDYQHSDQEPHHCAICGLPSNYPQADLDDEGICADCRGFAQFKEDIARYFRTPKELQQLLQSVKDANLGHAYDCMVLVSGGKDSTYMLYQLVREYGMRPLVFSLDNGYISEQALDNIRNTCVHLGVDLEIATTPHMNAIFADSLRRHSNVCDGCYKTIYTLSTNLAQQHGISTIITGLARGQLFETRLSDTFRARCFDPDVIDNWIMDARKAYHQIEDATIQLLDVRIFANDNVFNEIQYLDFYRYTDVHLDKVYDYLAKETVWHKPDDTGRSTNCLINDVGIYIHQKERGFHNYALPYSWDVRLGHKTRDLAMHELDDDLDLEEIQRILDEVGYDENETRAQHNDKRLAAYYVSDTALSAADLREFLAQYLPDYMIPSIFMQLASLPLTSNGKIDRSALPDSSQYRPDLETQYVAPTNRREEVLLQIWTDIFQLSEIGIYDNYFDLGGDSIISIQIVARARQAGLQLSPGDIFENQTVAELAAVAGDGAIYAGDQGLVAGSMPLTPIQKWFFAQEFAEPHYWNQSLWLDLPADIDISVLSTAFQELILQHDALRLRFSKTSAGWQQNMLETEVPFPVHAFDLSALSDVEREHEMQKVASDLESSLNLERGPLAQASLFRLPDGLPVRLFVTVHHLVIDGISWRPLLEDLEDAYHQKRQAKEVKLPRKSSSFKQWAERLANLSHKESVVETVPIWQGNLVRNAIIGRSRPPTTNSQLETVSSILNVDDTHRLLHNVSSAYNTNINDLLLTAATMAFTTITHQETFAFMLEGHGRDETYAGELDLTRTVGWFTTQYPVALTLPEDPAPGTAIKSVKEQLRLPSANGVSYGLLRYLRSDLQLAKGQDQEILFNYMGQFERSLPSSGFFSLARPLRAGFGPNNHPTHALSISSLIWEKALYVDFTFDPQRIALATVKRMVDSFIMHLETLIAHCVDLESTEYTRSDFDLVDLDDKEFDRLIDVLNRLDK